MDKSKTGALIAQTRKEKNMTQKELAAILHVSDRAISKWERGAGFPDVSLLEPLAAALHLNVLDLLRGEETEETDVHAAVQEALHTFQEERRRDRRQICRDLLQIVIVLLPFVLFWLYIRPLQTDVDRTVTAGVYREGELVAYTGVEVKGEIDHYLLTGKCSYWGRFAVECVPWTTRNQVNGGISLNSEYDGFTYASSGKLTMELYDIDTYVNRDLTEFAFALTKPDDEHGWYILASSPTAYQMYRNGYAGYKEIPELRSPREEKMPRLQAPW